MITASVPAPAIAPMTRRFSRHAPGRSTATIHKTYSPARNAACAQVSGCPPKNIADQRATAKTKRRQVTPSKNRSTWRKTAGRKHATVTRGKCSHVCRKVQKPKQTAVTTLGNSLQPRRLP